MDRIKPEQRSALMARIRSKDTAPEMAVRKLAHQLGYRFRLHRRDLPGAPDLVFPRLRRVVFVHGCFWHQHDARDTRSSGRCGAVLGGGGRQHPWRQPEDRRSAHSCGRTACERAKIEDFRIHDMRHTFASHLVQNGVPLLEVKDLLGHKTLAMVMRYAHLAPDNLRNAVDRLPGHSLGIVKQQPERTAAVDG